MVGELDLRGVSVYDPADLESDPLAEEQVAALDGVVDRYLAEAQGPPDPERIEAWAEVLGRRFRGIGARDEPRIMVIGEKGPR